MTTTDPTEIEDDARVTDELLVIAMTDLEDAIHRLEDTLERHERSDAGTHEQKIAAIDADVPGFAKDMMLLIDMLESNPQPLASLHEVLHAAIREGLYHGDDQLERRLLEFQTGNYPKHKCEQCGWWITGGIHFPGGGETMTCESCCECDD